jgi:hypothetical protein
MLISFCCCWGGECQFGQQGNQFYAAVKNEREKIFLGLLLVQEEN